MATPTLAAASAGASLTPSPTIATIAPAATRALTRSSFASGSSSASTSLIPEFARHRRRRLGFASPVSKIVRMPMRCSASMAPRASGRTVSARAIAPRMSVRARHRNWSRAFAACIRCGGHGDTVIAQQQHDCRPARRPCRSVPRNPAPGRVNEVVRARLWRGLQHSRTATMAFPSGCSERNSAAAAASSTSLRRSRRREQCLALQAAEGERAGLVEHHSVHTAERFEITGRP